MHFAFLILLNCPFYVEKKMDTLLEDGGGSGVNLYKYPKENQFFSCLWIGGVEFGQMSKRKPIFFRDDLP